MKTHARHVLVTGAVLALLAAGGLAFAWSGFYDIGADSAHSRPVYSLLEMARERSVITRSRRLHPPPDLEDEPRIRQGAGNYAAMCTGCHLAPGMAPTELSLGLYPAPPNLAAEDASDPAFAFWVIKHGIKASGMPAWGRSMGDEYIWNMAAFLQKLPGLSEAEYSALVASSGGHDHGGGETGGAGHPHAADDTDGAHADMAADHHGGEKPAAGHPHPPGTPAHVDPPAQAPAMRTHRHADGTVESHPVAPAKPKADDGHDHQH